MEIVVDIYSLTKNYPQSELFSLVSQMRRASMSIPSNIAEGFNRLNPKEFRRFLTFSLGSCAELETQIEASFRLKYISEVDLRRMNGKLDHEQRMMRRLMKG
ncbi:hypothetical protein BVX98_01290 [bacterium F11]|nr:hypothetical protein BVX98_01290 [bacterium F11]